ncbi:tannase/feruloyl esterase family alpha/beta hydrolase [Ramlibacter sp. G-1-2-2]|uniref:Tannase/feruloyl esterase family alpha/beta hydrolase n=1 Tax=Ramlibacter agri TaxID=2728837 RepID=A0A848H9E4_9BURK|nr:tannase/feruloyl esterase family alpha/beta hydrolase [Ramlibacter agri]NML47616.1 tannase/feruloyl esterase family alpha/beta hydrolase [Ramlibacter agri]
MRAFFILAAALAASSAFAAQSKLPCASLAGRDIPASAIGLPTSGATITAAALVAAAPETIGDKAVVHALPEYCRILGTIRPVDPAAPPIRFQLNVPTAWNGKTIQVGGGGLNGSIPANLAAITSSSSPISGAFPPDAPYPLASGYAMFGGDSGHQEPGLTATWALNDEAWLNFAHAALKKTHDAAFAIIDALYGSRPTVSYFMGQSQGGREAMEVAQRYPDDYDGVVATSPLIGYSAHVIHKTMLATLQAGAGWIPPAKYGAIQGEVMRQCDALDGLQDGVIGNYLGCAALFDPQKVAQPYAAIRCADGAETGNACVSNAQIATLNRMHAPLRFGFALANGWTEFPGYELGREAMPGWLALQPQPSHAAQPALGQPGATVSYGILKDPAFNLVDFAIPQFRERIVAASALIDSTNPDLTRFFARGGKLIIKAQGSDYASNPHIVMRWYDQVVARFGQGEVDRHVRFYMLPNGDHGGSVRSTASSEPVPQYVDLVRMATDWVEQGAVPPDAPVLRAMAALPPYAVSATRPLCRYPLYPRYVGSDAKSADSFRCTAP